MRIAKLHTRAPQPLSEALTVYRKAMRVQMRAAHAADAPWLAQKIARARDIPDGEHLQFMAREAAPDSAEVEATLTQQWLDMRKAARTIAAVCVRLMKDYLSTLPRVPKRQPASSEKTATYPREQTVRRRERRRERRRAHERGVVEEGGSDTAERCIMWRTRPARAHLAERLRRDPEQAVT